MSRTLIWDLPCRLFHWLLIGGLAAAFAIAQLSSKRGSVFPHHAIIGIVLGGMLVLRLIWGIVGTKYARFTSYIFSPRALMNYFQGIAAGRHDQYVGHNPASSWVIVLMLGLLGIIVASGILLGLGHHAYGDIHSIAVYVLLGASGVHTAGVLLHSYRHRENITLGMITGRKETDAAAAIPSSARVAAIIFLLLISILTASLYRNYDATHRSTRLLGTALSIGDPGQHGSAPFKDNRR